MVFIKDKARLEINGETLREAIQLWVDEHMSSPVKVEDIQYNYGGMIITLSSPSSTEELPEATYTNAVDPK